MHATFRPGIQEDAQACGTVFFKAFKLIAEQHNFPVDFPLPETAVSLLTQLLSREDVYSVVAEMERGIVGSNFLWEAEPVMGVGPITVEPSVQARLVGRRLMERVLERGRERRKTLFTDPNERSIDWAAAWRIRSGRALECSGPAPSYPWGSRKTSDGLSPHFARPDVTNWSSITCAPLMKSPYCASQITSRPGAWML